MRPFLLTLLWLTSTVFLQACAKPPYTDISAEQTQAMLKQGVALVDIRRPDEWRQTGVVDGSHTITFVDQSGRLVPGFLTRFTRTVAQDQPVMIMCHTGSRSSALARYLMEEQGYTRVYNVKDGIRGWLRQRLPVIGGNPQRG